MKNSKYALYQVLCYLHYIQGVKKGLADLPVQAIND